MLHDIAVDTKALCRVCMAPKLEHPADLYDATPSGLPSLHEMLRAICAPVFEKSEADFSTTEKPTKVCLVCQNAIVAAFNLHQQCIETDLRLGELEALKWELQEPGGDEVDDDCGVSETSSSWAANLLMSDEHKMSKIDGDNTCLECGKTFSSKASLTRHVREGFCDRTDDRKQRTCEICNKVLNTIQLLKRHREMHDSINGVKHAESDEPKPAAEQSTTILDHTSQGPVDMIKVEPLDLTDENDSDHSLLEEVLNMHAECSKCGASFSSIRAHRNHEKAKNCQRALTFPCRICGKIFDKQTRLQYHLYTHKERVACSQCNDTFRNRAGLLVHIKRKRCSKNKLGTSQNVSQRKLKTQITHATSTEQSEPPDVQNQMSGEKVSESNESLIVEMPAQVRDTPAKTKRTIDIQCTDCGVTFSSSRAHKTHTQEGNCQEKQTYPCKICGKIFDTHSRRTYHYYTHNERYSCSMCNESFRSKARLQTHRCSDTVPSQTPIVDGLSEPLVDVALVTQATRNEAFRDPLLNKGVLDIVKVEEPEIEDAEMKLESKIFVEPMTIAGMTKVCELCSKTFERMTTLRLHMKRNHQLYICGKCCATFETEQLLEDHIKVSHFVVRVNCSKCDQSFESRTALRMHKKYGNCLQELTQTPKAFSCDLCPKTFESAVKLGYHRANHRRIFCQECGFCLGSKRELQAHIAKGKCLGDKARTCRVCKKVFDTVAEFKVHRKEAHPGPVDCPDCGRKLANLNSFRNHITEGRCEHIKNGTAPGIVPRTCKICGELQVSISQLRSHMKAKHLDQIYYCASCLLHFPTKKKFDLHMEKHTKNLVNICQTCNTSFPTMAALKRHKFTHIGSVKCTICDRSFVRNFDLKAHMTIHTGKKPHACELCRMRFRTLLGKKRHMQSHSDQPTAAVYVCDICGSKFTSTQTLKMHVMTTHEGIRPFECSLCDLKFSRPQHLKRHMLTHTKERPFKCAVCPQAYAQSSDLVKHVAREHDGDGNAYACDRCDKSFRLIAELRKHYAEHFQAGDDMETGAEEVRFTSVALLNMRFAKEKQQKQDEESGDSDKG